MKTHILRTVICLLLLAPALVAETVAELKTRLITEGRVVAVVGNLMDEQPPMACTHADGPRDLIIANLLVVVTTNAAGAERATKMQIHIWRDAAGNEDAVVADANIANYVAPDPQSLESPIKRGHDILDAAIGVNKYRVLEKPTPDDVVAKIRLLDGNLMGLPANTIIMAGIDKNGAPYWSLSE